MMALLDPFRMRRGVPDEREGRVTLVTFDAQLAEHDEDDEDDEREAQAAQPKASPVAPSNGAGSGPRQRAVRVVGALTYNRADLERVIAAGEELDIDVVGYLSFSDDVTPELIERTIARLRYRGVLSASSEVLKALKRKESPAH
jgi:hypothetical protein